MDHLDGALSVHAGSDADALVREVNARQAVVIDDTAAVLRRGTNPIRAVGVAARNAAAVNPATGCLIRCLATLAAAAVPVLADDTALRATGSRGRAWRTGVRAAAAEAVVAVMESATGVAPIAWSTLTGRARPAGMAVGGAAVRVVRARRGIWRTAGRVATAIDDGRGALQVAATVGTVRAAAGAVKRDAACSAATDPPRPTTDARTEFPSGGADTRSSRAITPDAGTTGAAAAVIATALASTLPGAAWEELPGMGPHVLPGLLQALLLVAFELLAGEQGVVGRDITGATSYEPTEDRAD
jgi:hypothetical protein